MSDSSKLQSTTIDFLRFPLILMVLFIHMSPKTINLIDADFSLLSAQGITNLMKIMLSHVVVSSTVPVFFVISGFLFFHNLHVQDPNLQKWSLEGYKKKIKSRIKTLLVPYFIWNLIPFILSVAIGLIFELKSGCISTGTRSFLTNKAPHIFYDFYVWEGTKTDWLGNPLSSAAPFDVPLWYIRDLFIVCLLTPLIYVAIKRLKISVIIVLFLAYISRIWTQIPGLGIESIFFFSLGSYFALEKLSIVEFAHKYKYIIMPTWIILLVVCTIYDAGRTNVGHYAIPFYVCAAVFATFYLASLIVDKYRLKPNKILVSSCFFIFAFHEVNIPVVGCLLKFVHQKMQLIIQFIFSGNSIGEDLVCYIATPPLTAAICIVVFISLMKIAPGITKTICGNR